MHLTTNTNSKNVCCSFCESDYQSKYNCALDNFLWSKVGYMFRLNVLIRHHEIHYERGKNVKVKVHIKIGTDTSSYCSILQADLSHKN